VKIRVLGLDNSHVALKRRLDVLKRTHGFTIGPERIEGFCDAVCSLFSESAPQRAEIQTLINESSDFVSVIRRIEKKLGLASVGELTSRFNSVSTSTVRVSADVFSSAGGASSKNVGVEIDVSVDVTTAALAAAVSLFRQRSTC